MNAIRYYLSGRTTRFYITKAPLFALLFLLHNGAYCQNGMLLNELGYIGIGTESPKRQLHMTGPNALFRMDRTQNSSAFYISRIAPTGGIYKAFIVGVNGYSVNDGEFFITDMGTTETGGGNRRMTINKTGDVLFTGNVTAKNISTSSALRYKTDIQPIVNANMSVSKLKGVRFNWKDSGRAGLGLIAEDVAEVFPEVVEWNENTGQAEAINYTALTAVLVEALKELQDQLDMQNKQLLSQRELIDNQKIELLQLRGGLEQIEIFKARLSVVEDALFNRAILTAAAPIN